MSFEGYYQCLCEVGHYAIQDLYTDLEKCPVCSGSIVYHNLVDETNGEPTNKKEFEVLVPAKTKMCMQTKVIAPTRYKIPGVDQVVNEVPLEGDPAKEFVEELKELLTRYGATLSCNEGGEILLEIDGVTQGIGVLR